MPPETRSPALARQLGADVLARLNLSGVPVQSVDKGKWLKSSDQRLYALPYIESGRLDAVLHFGEDGSQVIPVTFGPGELALLSALFSDEPIYGDLIAARPLQFRWLPIKDVEAVLLSDKDLLVVLARFLTQRLREVRARERGWLERGVHERVLAGLTRIALETVPTGPDEPWLIPSTHEQLAFRCGVSRPKLSKELKQLESTGALRQRRGSIELLDYSVLTARL